MFDFLFVLRIFRNFRVVFFLTWIDGDMLILLLLRACMTTELSEMRQDQLQFLSFVDMMT